jgi:hypothetical protein
VGDAADSRRDGSEAGSSSRTEPLLSNSSNSRKGYVRLEQDEAHSAV